MYKGIVDSLDEFAFAIGRKIWSLATALGNRNLKTETRKIIIS